MLLNYGKEQSNYHQWKSLVNLTWCVCCSLPLFGCFAPGAAALGGRPLPNGPAPELPVLKACTVLSFFPVLVELVATWEVRGALCLEALTASLPSSSLLSSKMRLRRSLSLSSLVARVVHHSQACSRLSSSLDTLTVGAVGLPEAFWRHTLLSHAGPAVLCCFCGGEWFGLCAPQQAPCPPCACRYHPSCACSRAASCHASACCCHGSVWLVLGWQLALGGQVGWGREPPWASSHSEMH